MVSVGSLLEQERGEPQVEDGHSKHGDDLRPEDIPPDPLQEDSAYDGDEIAKGIQIGYVLDHRRHVLNREGIT